MLGEDFPVWLLWGPPTLLQASRYPHSATRPNKHNGSWGDFGGILLQSVRADKSEIKYPSNPRGHLPLQSAAN